MRGKGIKTATIKYIRVRSVSTVSLFMAAVFFILGAVAITNNLVNLGPILIAFGVMSVFLGFLPLMNAPGWVVALISLTVIGGVILFVVPYMDVAINELIVAIEEEIDSLIPTFPSFP